MTSTKEKERNSKTMKKIGDYRLTTSQSKNKKLYFKNEPFGTNIYFVRKKNDEYEMYAGDEYASIDYDSKSSVKSASTQKVFLYIPIKQNVFYEGTMSLYQTDEHRYLLKKAKKQKATRKLSKTGDIAQFNGTYRLSVSKKDRMRAGLDQYVKMHVVQNKEHLYIEATPITEEETEKLPTLVEAASPYHGWGNLKDADEFTYYNTVKYVYGCSAKISLPVCFVRNADAVHKDHLHTWLREDGTFVIEGKPVKCDVCGKPINRYFSKTHELQVCGKCRSNVRDLNRYIVKDQEESDNHNLTETLKQVSYDLSVMQASLENLINK